jgi:hypothetical protein
MLYSETKLATKKHDSIRREAAAQFIQPVIDRHVLQFLTEFLRCHHMQASRWCRSKYFAAALSFTGSSLNARIARLHGQQIAPRFARRLSWCIKSFSANVRVLPVPMKVTPR